MLRPGGWVLVAAFSMVGVADGQSLRGVPVPQPANLARYVQDQTKLVQLGKALFWDMQLGSDVRTACAELSPIHT